MVITASFMLVIIVFSFMVIITSFLMVIIVFSSMVIIASFFSRKNVRLAMDPIIHEDYQKDFQYNNDIALLKLAEEVDNQFLNIILLSHNLRSTLQSTPQRASPLLIRTTLARTDEYMVSISTPLICMGR